MNKQKNKKPIYLKAKLTTYPYVKDRIEYYQNELELIYYKMQGTSSSSNFSDTIKTSAGYQYIPRIRKDSPSYKNMTVELSDQLDEVQSRLNKYLEEYAEIERLIESIPDNQDKELVYDCYIKGHTHKQLSIKYSYPDENYINKKISSILKKVELD